MNFLKGKDFLNYYELGLYLNNLGYDLNLKDKKDLAILDSIIESLVIERKLDYLIYINDFVFITFNKKVGEHETDKPRGMPNIPIDGYFIMPLDTLRIFHCIEPSDEDSNTFQMLLLPFKIYSDFHYYYENYYSDEFIYDDKLDDYYHHITFNCGEFDKKTLMYSRQQLDNIFNQSITNPLKSTIATLQNQLEQQANQPSDTATDEKNPLKDIRTQNNLIRLLLAVNEMAKDKKGQSLDYSKDYNKENLQAINKKLDLLDYTNIGEAAFTTLATLIREKQGKGL